MRINILNIGDYVEIKDKYYKLIGSTYSDKTKKDGRGKRPVLKQLKDKDLRKFVRDVLIDRLKGGLKE